MNCINKDSKLNSVAAIIDKLKANVSDLINNPLEKISSTFMSAEIKDNSLQFSWRPIALLSFISIMIVVFVIILQASDSSPSSKLLILSLCACLMAYIVYKSKK